MVMLPVPPKVAGDVISIDMVDSVVELLFTMLPVPVIVMTSEVENPFRSNMAPVAMVLAPSVVPNP
jgi:hypothetical protein